MYTKAVLPALLIAAAPLALAQNSTSTSSASSATGTASAKRGLCYVTPTVETDDNFWDSSTSDLTWYYNYQTTPTTAFAKSDLQFLPMQWGAPSNPTTDMSFYNSVKTQLEGGANITAVLGFNEPDGCSSGGSCVSATVAAQVWKKQFEPLKWQYGLQLGAPAVTGANTGFTWLQAWHTACAALNGNDTGCIVDFIPAHWYGNFEGLASHLGQINGSYPNASSVWITEFAYADQDLSDAQDFYNQSTQYFDRLNWIGRYSYFGAFRSSVSNVGPNAAFLTQDGKLTDIGSWYLGGVATGNVPSSSSSSGSATTSSVGGTYTGKPYSSGSYRPGMFAGWAACSIAAAAWSFL